MQRGGASHFKKPDKFIRYVALFTFTVVVAFSAVLSIPYCYDQINLKQFHGALESKRLLIAELPIELQLRSENGSINVIADTTENPNLALENKNNNTNLLDGGYKIISLDYVKKMRDAERLKSPSFILISCLIGALLAVLIAICVALIHRHSIRAFSIGGLFLIALLGIQLFGLPHVNTKFHIIIGLMYAGLLALSDFLYTIDIGFNNGVQKQTAGEISALQYRHRFWTVIFNLSVAGVLTILVTVSFNVYDAFLNVFGLSFVQMPLVGILIAVGIALTGVFLGILRPIRVHLSNLEQKMSES